MPFRFNVSETTFISHPITEYPGTRKCRGILDLLISRSRLTGDHQAAMRCGILRMVGSLP